MAERNPFPFLLAVTTVLVPRSSPAAWPFETLPFEPERPEVFRPLESLFLLDFLETMVHLLFVSSAEVVLEELLRLGQYPPRKQHPLKVLSDQKLENRSIMPTSCQPAQKLLYFLGVTGAHPKTPHSLQGGQNQASVRRRVRELPPILLMLYCRGFAAASVRHRNRLWRDPPEFSRVTR